MHEHFLEFSKYQENNQDPGPGLISPHSSSIKLIKDNNICKKLHFKNKTNINVYKDF